MLKYRIYFYILAILLLLWGGISVNLLGLNLGIDLKGGEMIEIQTNLKNLENIFDKSKFKIRETQNSIIIKAPNLDENYIISKIKQFDPNAKIIRKEEVSSVFSGELAKKSYLAIIFVLMGIGTYITIVFWGKKRLIPGYLFGLVTILTLFHDVIGSLGLYTLFSHFFNYDLDISIIIAFLVVAGFSVHDTIVVFDRIRENLMKEGKLNQEIFEKSIKETLTRSINTSLSTILSILPLLFLIEFLRPFLLTLMVGIIIGTYSSICLAAPLLYDLSK